VLPRAEELSLRAPFNVFIAKFGKGSRYLPKGTVIGYAKRAPVAIIVPYAEAADDAVQMDTTDSEVILHGDTVAVHIVAGSHVCDRSVQFDDVDDTHPTPFAESGVF